MYKKVFLIFCFLIFTNCGFTPIHSSLEKKDILIEKIIFNEGDRKLNILIQRNLERYKNSNSKNIFIINGNTKYEKNIISKDTKGIATKYELKAIVNFKIVFGNNIEKITLKETFSMNHISDDFESKKYEETIKRNFANSITKNLVMKLSQIQ